ncbi:gamma carbonic anhydrase family protein [Microlunatus sp. Gsoil 973]|uniref:gamma carbonic anhydrase family protein n=1 Tax=Microlunatus sp. Gsoil 973 TaxID=2672569 RepID=UPI0012B4CD3C|nr:gamma carbonic anhydrase family protein [Microlunatus sp. Gsoil 973]QGN31715.1 gamma carbonic anhydrase family protein [Microlunatus sp. Gsoil 973]
MASEEVTTPGRSGGALVLPYGGKSPTIDPSAWLAPNATVIGDATLAEESSVYYGAVVRADMAEVRLGNGSNLQDNVVVHTDFGHPSLIGNGVSVRHLAVIHGCTIADNVLIGMGATVLNGAQIGTGSLVAAGTVILEGTVIPPRSLVAGVPGKVRRELSDAEVDKVITNARHYRDLTASHRRLNPGADR